MAYQTATTLERRFWSTGRCQKRTLYCRLGTLRTDSGSLAWVVSESGFCFESALSCITSRTPSRMVSLGGALPTSPRRDASATWLCQRRHPKFSGIGPPWSDAALLSRTSVQLELSHATYVLRSRGLPLLQTASDRYALSASAAEVQARTANRWTIEADCIRLDCEGVTFPLETGLNLHSILVTSARH